MAGKCDDSDLLAFLRQTHTNELAVANGVVSNGTTTPVMADKSRRSRDGPLVGTCVLSFVVQFPKIENIYAVAIQREIPAALLIRRWC
ncbi:hypothetical protein Q1695_005763 [Nippostrongylus brasiliensis]|nr:hypothetical protein Q1695_005763 [Nippostrongylus brasiliensis]